METKYSNRQLVIYDKAIYRVEKVEIKDEEVFYHLEFVAYIQDIYDNLKYEIAKKAIAKENELVKFDYAPPRYKMGEKGIKMVIFKESQKEYRYNLDGVCGLTWEDLVHRY